MAKPVRSTVLIIATLVASAPASAGNESGRIDQLMAHPGDVVMFSLDGEHLNKPACSTEPWALSLSTHTGRAMYALLLTAQAQGKQVYVQGAGDCSSWGDREAPLYIWIN